MRPLGYILDEPDDQGHAIKTEPWDGGVAVTWGCTTKRFATAEEIVENVARLQAFPDVWLVLRTRMDEAIYVRLEGGRLYASPLNPSDHAANCAWEDLKAALEAVNSNEGKGLVMT